MEPEVGLISGKACTFRDPDPKVFSAELVASSLSKQCRFVGHVREFYSTAQHSVYVSMRCTTPAARIWAMLHDAHEVIVGDISNPFKRYLDERAPGVIREVESRIDEAIHTAFSHLLPPMDSEEWAQIKREVKQADWDMLLLERDWLCPQTAKHYPDYDNPDLHPGGCILQVDPDPWAWDHETARVNYLRQFQALQRFDTAGLFVNPILESSFPQPQLYTIR